jgi:hypothetical protein
MKSARFVSDAVLALLLIGSFGIPARGQASQRITAEVPFDFMVKQVMFPAGTYVVTLGADDRTLYVRASHGRESMSLVAEPIRTASRSRSARLIFAEESGHYHLRELWVNSAIGRQVPGPPMVALRTVRAARLEVRAASCTGCQ